MRSRAGPRRQDRQHVAEVEAASLVDHGAEAKKRCGEGKQQSRLLQAICLVQAVALLAIAGYAVLGNINSTPGTQGGVAHGFTGANVWQMFRRACECPWTETPDSDEDCVHCRRVATHAMDSILRCGAGAFATNERSISHRGAPLVAPEHSLVGYELAVQGGAGFVECDVSVTKDLRFVCRHSLCDLQTTTDLLKGNRSHLSGRCSLPFTPATASSPASARCCTYDFTAAELQELCLRMDEDVNASATEAIYYTTGPPPWRSNGLTHPCQRVVTFQAYLSWARHRGINVIPELKGTAEPATLEFLRSNGKSREDLADMFLEELQAAGFNQPLVPSPSAVVSSPLKLQWLLPTQPKAIMQTFDRVVASHWKRRADLTPPVAYLYEKPGGECLPDDCGTEAVIQDLAAGGVEIMAPATAALVTSDGHRMVPSKHAWFLNSLGVSITSWSLDRSPCPGASPGQPAYAGPCGGYWAGLEGRSAFDWSDILLLMYTMYHEANVSSAFSDYPAVNSLFLNCVPRMPLGR